MLSLEKVKTLQIITVQIVKVFILFGNVYCDKDAHDIVLFLFFLNTYGT